MEWFYEKNGSQMGPVSEAALRELITSGAIRTSTLVWCEGMSDWASYASVFPEPAVVEASPVEAMETRTYTDLSSSGFRREAREALSGHWGPGVLVTFLYQLLLNVVMSIPLVGLVAPFIVSGPLLLGYHEFMLGLVRRKPVEVGTLFNGFSRFGQGIGIFCLMMFIIMCSSALASIPGGAFLAYVVMENPNLEDNVPLLVIALFCLIMPAVLVGTYLWLRYAMAYFIAYDHPEMGAMQVLKRSAQMMDGHKNRLGYLSLTYTGWFILGFLAFGIGLLWSSIYMFVGFAAFYDELRNRECTRD
jgi:uncharacterized membrane protein